MQLLPYVGLSLLALTVMVAGCGDRSREGAHRTADAQARVNNLLLACETSLLEGSELILPENLPAGAEVHIRPEVLSNIVSTYKESMLDHSPGTNIQDLAGNPISVRFSFRGFNTNPLGKTEVVVKVTAVRGLRGTPEVRLSSDILLHSWRFEQVKVPEFQKAEDP